MVKQKRKKQPLIIIHQSQLKTNSVFSYTCKNCSHFLFYYAIYLFPEDASSNFKKGDVERFGLKWISLISEYLTTFRSMRWPQGYPSYINLT